MVETTKAALDNPRLNTVFSAIGAIFAIAALIGVLNGWLTSGSLNSKDITQLRDQISALSIQVGNLSTRIEQGPRKDQLDVIDHHLSALDGRMDGMDTRVRADEDRLTRTETKVEGIDQASKAPLGHR